MSSSTQIWKSPYVQCVLWTSYDKTQLNIFYMPWCFIYVYDVRMFDLYHTIITMFKLVYQAFKTFTITSRTSQKPDKARICLRNSVSHKDKLLVQRDQVHVNKSLFFVNDGQNMVGIAQNFWKVTWFVQSDLGFWQPSFDNFLNWIDWTELKISIFWQE